MAVLAELLQHCTASAPLVLLLEDLQWADANSLDLVQWANRLAPDLPLLIVGTYRDHERQYLPKNLLDMRLLPLQRLAEPATAELSVDKLDKNRVS